MDVPYKLILALVLCLFLVNDLPHMAYKIGDTDKCAHD